MFSSIATFHEQLRSGAVTCVQATEYSLAQIARLNGGLRAFVEYWPEEALAQAAAMDAALASGTALKPLQGVIVGIKDVFHYKGHKVSAASQMLENYTATYTATCVQRLLNAGAIVIGRQNCDEFAMGGANENSCYQAALNPLDPSRIPGGSSGGSAAAVASGMCMISLGSDTGGSVRQPASHCGIVGWKPGYGTLSRYGLIAYASSFDVPGILATNIADAALAIEVMQGPDAMDPTCRLDIPLRAPSGKEAPLRFCYWAETLSHPALDPQIKNSFTTYFEKLRSAGMVVEPVAFPLMKYIVPAYYVLTTAEAATNLSRYDGVRYGHRTNVTVNALEDFYTYNRTEGFGREVKRRIMLGNFVLSAGYYEAYFSQAQKVRNILKKEVEETLSRYDAIIGPVVPSVARMSTGVRPDPVEEFLADIYTVTANLSGVAAISLPLFSHNIGMPYGLQMHVAEGSVVYLHRISSTLMHFAIEQ